MRGLCEELLAGLGAFLLADAVVRVSSATIAVFFGAAALDLYHWFNWPILARRIGGAAPWWFVWPARIVVFALSAWWVVRSIRKERRFLAETEQPQRFASARESSRLWRRRRQERARR